MADTALQPSNLLEDENRGLSLPRGKWSSNFPLSLSQRMVARCRVLAQFTSLQKPCTVMPWSPVLGALKATQTSLGCTQTLGGWSLQRCSRQGSQLLPGTLPVPTTQAPRGPGGIGERGWGHPCLAPWTVTGTPSFRARTEAVKVLPSRGPPPLCSPSLPVSRATGRDHPAASQGETEQGTSRLVQNTARVPPTACSGGEEKVLLKGQRSKTLDEWIPQRPETDTCLDVLIPRGLPTVPPAGSCRSNLDSGMCPVPIPGRAPVSTTG